MSPSTEPRSIEETERISQMALELVETRAERDSLLTRVSQLEGERDAHSKRASDNAERANKAEHLNRVAESRIESLVGEREELGEALERLQADNCWMSGRSASAIQRT